MHGLVNRALQAFLIDSYGADAWARVAAASQAPDEGFETMFVYDDDITFRIFSAAADILCRPVEGIQEDLGTYLVSTPRLGAIRRLLRFGGETFTDFLHSIDELPRRAALAVPDLELPALHLEEMRDARFTICCECADGRPAFFGHVLTGILRSMADEYGALVILEHQGAASASERIVVRVLSTEFAKARPFTLSAGV